MKYHFIQELSEGHPVIRLCQAMHVSTSAYYEWRKRPVKLITANELHLYRRAKALFIASRELCKRLRAESCDVGREKTRAIMKNLKLKVR